MASDFCYAVLGKEGVQRGFLQSFPWFEHSTCFLLFFQSSYRCFKIKFSVTFFFGLSVIVLKRRKSIHDVHKATKRPKKGAGTQKPAIAPYKEPTQSKNSDNDKELSPIYNLTQSQKRFKKELLIV